MKLNHSIDYIEQKLAGFNFASQGELITNN